MVNWSEYFFHFSLAASRILSILVGALSVLLVLEKIISRRWEMHKLLRRTQVEEWSTSYLAEENPMSQLSLETLGWIDRMVLRSLLLEKSEAASGLLQRRIEDLYDRTGLAAEDIRAMARSWRWWRRAEAAHCLGQIRLKRAKGHLLKALQDKNTEVRLEATWALGRMRLAESLPEIMKSMAHYFKIAALRMDDFIFQVGAPALPLLIDLSRDAEPETRLLAIHLIGEFKNLESLRVLIPLLTEGPDEIRLAACKAMGTIGDPEGLKELIPRLRDPFWPIRAQAAKQLGIHKFQQATPELIFGLEDRQWWVRYNSGEALAAMGSLGKYALSFCLQSQDRFARDMAAQWLDEMEAAKT